MTKLLIEASVLEQDNPSGVNYLTDSLVSELEKQQDSTFSIGFFWLNFLGCKKAHNKNTLVAAKRGELQQLRLIPQRLYAKLVYNHVAPPLPVRKTDWVLFPNFYIWPTMGRHKKAVIIHDLCYLRYPEYVEDKNRAFLARVATNSIERSDLILVDSEFIANEIVELIGISRDMIHVLGVPVNTSEFDIAKNLGRKRLADRYNITKPYILSFGTLEPRKNLTTLVEAYCMLPSSIRNTYSLVLAGKWGWKIDDLRQLIEQKRSEGYDIITTDYVDHGDRTTFYRNASFYAITTHYEGFGMPLLEALHCGIPTVAVDIPVLREVGGDACLWAEKNSKDVASKLSELIADKELARQLSRKGNAQSSKYSWKKTARSLIMQLKLR